MPKINKKNAKPANSRKPAKAAPAKRNLNMTNSDSKAPGTLSGYRGHRPGSRKESIHKLFDSCKDREKIMAAGLKAKLSPATLNTWLAAWGGNSAMGAGAFKARKAA